MDPTLEKEVDRLGRSSRVAAAVTLLGVVGVVLAMAYATSQLRKLQLEVAASEARLSEVNKQREQASVRVEILQKEITKAEADKRKYQEQILELTSKIEDLKRLLTQTADMSRFRHPVDMVDLKQAASDNFGASRALALILQLRDRNVRWNLGGTLPEEGFDSPSFAAYVLQSLRLIDYDPQRDIAQPSKILRSLLSRTDHPEVGDLVFYPGGYALFFFKDHNHKPFVIGMTPIGIVALEPDFAPKDGVARLNYRR